MIDLSIEKYNFEDDDSRPTTKAPEVRPQLLRTAQQGVEHPHQGRVHRTPNCLQTHRTTQWRHQFLRSHQYHPQYAAPYRGIGIPISDDRKDKINVDFIHKEIRVLNFESLLNTAASLKKEREENYRG